MEQGDEKRMNKVVNRLAAVTRDITDGQAASITVDFQASGEFPYRIVIPEEQYPVVGLARADEPTDQSGTLIPT